MPCICVSIASKFLFCGSCGRGWSPVRSIVSTSEICCCSVRVGWLVLDCGRGGGSCGGTGGSIGTGGSTECCDGVDIGVVGVRGVDCGMSCGASCVSAVGCVKVCWTGNGVSSDMSVCWSGAGVPGADRSYGADSYCLCCCSCCCVFALSAVVVVCWV